MRPLSPRERRLLALGLLIFAVGLFWLAVINPLVGGFVDRDRQRADLRLAYQRNERLIASLPALRAAAEAQRATAARFAISAPSEALAAEALKERLQRLASDEGFTLGSVEDLQADAPAGQVKMRADLTATLTQFHETMRRLENEDAYVVVDYLSVSADRSLAANHLAPLDIRLELTADWQPIRGRP